MKNRRESADAGWNRADAGPYHGGMARDFTHCLTHQLPEDQPSPIGLVCPECKQRLYVEPPAGRYLAFWESQPGAYALDGEPCWVFALVWEDFRIRSLHPRDSQSDPRSRRIAQRSVPS